MSLWGLFSTYRINKICKKKEESFDPLEGTLLDLTGFCFGWSSIALLVCYFIVEYLP
jgi:hypothetical protein